MYLDQRSSIACRFASINPEPSEVRNVLLRSFSLALSFFGCGALFKVGWLVVTKCKDSHAEGQVVGG